jgi:hypothetical protein
MDTQFIVDESGSKNAIILFIEDYFQMLRTLACTC